MSDWRSGSRRKRSVVWQVPIEEFANHRSMASVLRSLGLHVGAGNYKTLRARIAADNIDVSHFNANSERSKNGNKGTPLSEILVEDSTYKGGSSKLKKKLLDAGLLENACSICGLDGEWNGISIVHRLDHINGNSSDCRIENLRMICPNCDSQLPTFAGRNRRVI